MRCDDCPRQLLDRRSDARRPELALGQDDRWLAPRRDRFDLGRGGDRRPPLGADLANVLTLAPVVLRPRDVAALPISLNQSAIGGVLTRIDLQHPFGRDHCRVFDGNVGLSLDKGGQRGEKFGA